jgi:hypothetical protein
MRPLTSHDVLSVWERGAHAYPFERGLIMLALACPDSPVARLAELAIGERDRLLFRLHALTFGSTLQGWARCPACGERVEFSLPVDENLLPSGDEDGKVERTGGHALEVGDLQVSFRLPSSADLRAAAECQDEAGARSLIVGRCVIEAVKAGGPVPTQDTEPLIVDALAHAMAEQDPLGDILVELGCPGCGRSWQQVLDIVSLLWRMLEARAGRLLREVHALASAYGWSEEAILALSPERRRCYVEMVG